MNSIFIPLFDIDMFSPKTKLRRTFGDPSPSIGRSRSEGAASARPNSAPP